MFQVTRVEGGISHTVTLPKAESWHREATPGTFDSAYYIFKDGEGLEVARIRFDVVTSIVDLR